MRSGKFNYTLEEKAKLFGQFASAMEIAREQHRPYDRVKRCLQAIISDDLIVSITPKVSIGADGSKLLHVVGNFDNAAQALDAGKYDYHWGYAETSKKIVKAPMIVQPIDRHVRITPLLGRYVKTSEMFDFCPKIADPMTLFTLGAKFSNSQLDGPIFVVWKDHAGQFWYAMLSFRGGKRGVSVGLSHPDAKWDKGCRALLCE